MKKILLFLSALHFIFFGHAQKTAQEPLTKVDSMLVHIDKKALTTGILYERVSAWASLDVFNDNEENTSNTGHFEQALHELHKASNKKKFAYYRELRKQYTAIKYQNVVDVGIINATFQSLNYNESNEEQGGLRLVNQRFQPINNKAPFVTQQVLVASPLKKYVVGQEIVFNVDPTFYFEETIHKKIKILTVDFGTNRNYTLISNGILKPQKIPVRYSKTGKKTIVFTARFLDGTSLSSKANIKVKVLPVSYSKTTTDPLVEDFKKKSNIPFQGYDESFPISGEVDYRIFYDKINNNKVLNKPIVIIDGFDPLDQRKIQDSDPRDKLTDDEHVSIVEMMTYMEGANQRDIVNILRELGYDVVIVNHPVYTREINGVQTQIDGGADYIERNAMNHVTLYQHLNSILAQNGSNEQLVIVGPSMGGQISRYALAYMEKHNIPHNTRLWVSVDSPHLGANIPLGIQSLVNMIASTGNVNAEDFAEDQLGSPAARQQLIEQYSSSDGYNLDGRTVSQGYLQTNGHPFYTQFYNGLFSNGLSNSKGYPQNLRKIALVNGSLSGSKAFKNPYKINHYDFNDNNALRDDYFANSGEQVLDIVGIKNILGVKIVGTRLHAYFMPDLGYGTIAHFYRKKDPYYNIKRSITNANFRGNMDNIPGGWFPTQQILAKTTDENKPSELSWFEKRKIEHVNSFIPTVSALGFKNPNFNWSQRIDRNLVCSNEIPFDGYFGPKINERHTSFTEASVNWLKAELSGNPQSPSFPISPDKLLGEDYICNAETFTFDSCSTPEGVQNWEVSSNLQILSSTTNAVTVKPNVSYPANGWIKATFNASSSLTKNIQLNNTLLNTNDFNVTDEYYNAVSGSGSFNDPFLVCPNSSYILGYSGNSVVDLSTMSNVILPYGWSGYSYGALELLFTPGNFYGNPERIDISYQGECGNALHSVYFAEDSFNCSGGWFSYRVAPNPAESDELSIVNIENEDTIKRIKPNAKVEFLLYNDQSILKKQKREKGNKKEYKLDISKLKNGFYYLKIIREEKTETHKVVIYR